LPSVDKEMLARLGLESPTFKEEGSVRANDHS